jgi:hypothetical protein
MPLPIDVSADVQSFAAGVETFDSVEDFMEPNTESGGDAYQLIANRRAQLEDAETLRRMRAL